jgi:hypothetical protein
MESQPLLDSFQRIKPQWEIDSDNELAETHRQVAAWRDESNAQCAENAINLEIIRASFASIDESHTQMAAIRARRLAEENMPFAERVERRKIVILENLTWLLEATKRIFSNMPKVFQAIAAMIATVAMAILGYVAYRHISPTISQ